MKSRKNLSYKITGFILLIVFLLNISMVTAFYFVLDRKSQTYFNSSVNKTMAGISNYYQVPVWNLDKKIIGELTEALLQSEIIRAIKITDESSHLIYENSVDNLNFDKTKLQNQWVYKKTKIMYLEKDFIGHIEVLFSDESSKKQNKMTILRFILVVSFFSFLIIVGIYFLLNHLLRHPLDILLKAIQSANETQYSVRINHKFPGELALIADEFNRAMVKIQESEKQLQIQNNNLEKIVSERTKQIDEQRAQMINASRLVALGEFSAGMAHEINNPLTVIAGNARIISSALKKGIFDKNYEHNVQKISDMCFRIHKIIKNLRSFARDGKNDSMTEFDLKKFVEDVSLLTKVTLENRQIEFQCINSSDLTTLFGQEIPLSQVIINIINNAADAVMELPEKWVKLEIFQDNQFLNFVVTDSGTGIPFAIQQKMMDPFFTTKDVGKGTGLGLSISLGIIQNHQGEIIYNSESANTQFIIKVPLNLAKEVRQSA